MHTIATNAFPDEKPTVPTAPTTGRQLVFAARVDRLAMLAIERLGVDPDPDAIAAALGDLLQIRDLCHEAAR
jgi:hypothetical protein